MMWVNSHLEVRVYVPLKHEILKNLKVDHLIRSILSKFLAIDLVLFLRAMYPIM